MILQKHLPYDVLAARDLPGVAPLDPAQWLLVDEAYAEQMQVRLDLMRDAPDEVLWCDPAAHGAATEMLQTVLASLPRGFVRDGAQQMSPDGRVVALEWHDPFGTAGKLVQEDLCLMTKTGDVHVLRGAVLCFPASWQLQEKAGRPLVQIHAPVAAYDDTLARRVQRLFDGVRVGRPLWRCNALWYENPTLYQPRSETAPRALTDTRTAPYLRSERQVILRLPKSGAVVFSIHTYVLARTDLSDPDLTNPRRAGQAQ